MTTRTSIRHSPLAKKEKGDAFNLSPAIGGFKNRHDYESLAEMIDSNLNRCFNSYLNHPKQTNDIKDCNTLIRGIMEDNVQISVGNCPAGFNASSQILTFRHWPLILD